MFPNRSARISSFGSPTLYSLLFSFLSLPRSDWGFGVRRGTHVLKALALGAKACSFGKGYLYALSAGGQPGVEAILRIMHAEIKRGI